MGPVKNITVLSIFQFSRVVLSGPIKFLVEPWTSLHGREKKGVYFPGTTLYRCVCQTFVFILQTHWPLLYCITEVSSDMLLFVFKIKSIDGTNNVTCVKLNVSIIFFQLPTMWWRTLSRAWRPSRRRFLLQILTLNHTAFRKQSD